MSLKETNRFDRAPAADRREVTYPARVHFRVVAEPEAFSEAALRGLLAGYRVVEPLAKSQASSSGRYQAYGVSLDVRDAAELHAFDAAVKQVPGVRMLL
ncbi:MAG: DUF493 domain-containing protein [Verrucomicrobiota bacterium]|jgi:putative lipoic acid-binding regulatory protein|nr:DUF493 domain-containing protein [Verrucomicrobiota bacterium]